MSNDDTAATTPFILGESANHLPPEAQKIYDVGRALRAELSRAIVGQETDGTMTPGDLGMDWIVNMTKGDFIGRRSLTRADTERSGRKQLVGLLTEDPDTVLAEGAQLVASAEPGPLPAAMSGHVTSSYHSANLGRSIALAMVRNGRARIGETLFAAMADRTIAAVTLTILIIAEVAVRRNFLSLIAIPATFCIGVSCGLPLYLFLRTAPIK